MVELTVENAGRLIPSGVGAKVLFDRAGRGDGGTALLNSSSVRVARLRLREQGLLDEDDQVTPTGEAICTALELLVYCAPMVWGGSKEERGREERGLAAA